jgi:hypothetical protein
MSYSACQIGPSVSHWFQGCHACLPSAACCPALRSVHPASHGALSPEGVHLYRSTKPMRASLELTDRVWTWQQESPAQAPPGPNCHSNALLVRTATRPCWGGLVGDGSIALKPRTLKVRLHGGSCTCILPFTPARGGELLRAALRAAVEGIRGRFAGGCSAGGRRCGCRAVAFLGAGCCFLGYTEKMEGWLRDRDTQKSGGCTIASAPSLLGRLI